MFTGLKLCQHQWTILNTVCLCLDTCWSRYGDEGGISTLTFEASLAYVVLKDPKTFILEMVWKRNVRDIFIAKLRESCPEYAIWSGIINSNECVPTSRTRFYVVGINVTKVGFLLSIRTYQRAPEHVQPTITFCSVPCLNSSKTFPVAFQ